MIYDCFQFFNELDMLKIRLNVMSPIVDKFVISEATETFSGLKKPLYYEENKEMFAEFADKIIHVVVDDTPEGYTHDRDTFQKNAVTRGLKDCTDEDIIIFSDLDEIPNPEKIKEILKDYDVSYDTTVGYDENAAIMGEMGQILGIGVFIIAIALILTSTAYMEVPVLLITFGIAALLNMGSNFIFDKIITFF